MAHILVAEDDSNIRTIIASILECQGHSIHEAADGIEAFSLAQKESYDLLVTDIGMPEKDGIELITDLRKLMPDLTILAISAGGICSAGHYLDQAIECGANQTLRKPFSRQQLINAVDTLLMKAIPSTQNLDGTDKGKTS
ncbi:response regulator transcription factor [Planctomycetota bacterium]